jgi:hypothetical protein
MRNSKGFWIPAVVVKTGSVENLRRPWLTAGNEIFRLK